MNYNKNSKIIKTRQKKKKTVIYHEKCDNWDFEIKSIEESFYSISVFNFNRIKYSNNYDFKTMAVYLVEKKKTSNTLTTVRTSL